MVGDALSEYAEFIQRMTVLFLVRVEFCNAINYVCSFLCLTLTMHRYLCFLLNHYQPLVNAKHLARLDMMRTVTMDTQTPRIRIGLKNVQKRKSTQWSHRQWNFSFAADQSQRRSMEDRMSYWHDPANHNIHMFSIYDGHGGSCVADYLESHFQRRVIRMLGDKQQRHGEEIFTDDAMISAAITDECERLDAEMIDALRAKPTQFMGSTLISALVDHNRYLTVINVGDSRAIGCDESGDLVRLSTDHKPSLPSERERIEKAGGYVEYWGVERVQGILAVSRSFGDSALKRPLRLVVAEPEVRRIDLKARPLRYAILASDGFWDVVSSDEAVREANYILQRDTVNAEPDESAEDDEEEEFVVDVESRERCSSPTLSEHEDSLSEESDEPRSGCSDDFSRATTVSPQVLNDAVDRNPKRSVVALPERRRDSSTSASTQSANSSRRSSAQKSTPSTTTRAAGFSRPDIAAHLVQLALRRKTPDNVSVFFIQLDRF